MDVVCPHCRHVFTVTTRAKMGEGTRRGKGLKMSKNRFMILYVLRNRKWTVQQVLSELITNQYPRESKRGTKWNYHTVQADLSNLVGGKYVLMETDGTQQFNTKSGEFEVKQLPLYTVSAKGEEMIEKHEKSFEKWKAKG